MAYFFRDPNVFCSDPDAVLRQLCRVTRVRPVLRTEEPAPVVSIFFPDRRTINLSPISGAWLNSLHPGKFLMATNEKAGPKRQTHFLSRVRDYRDLEQIAESFRDG